MLWKSVTRRGMGRELKSEKTFQRKLLFERGEQSQASRKVNILQKHNGNSKSRL